MIHERRAVYSTPWFELFAKDTALDAQPYYSIRQADYVCVIALTAAGDCVFVRQYRPAVEAYTLELASGLVDDDATPEETALRELEEEAGYTASQPELLGSLYPDTGRLQNRMWCYVVRDARPVVDAAPEHGMEAVVVPMNRIDEILRKGELSCALHYAAFMLWRLRSDR